MKPLMILVAFIAVAGLVFLAGIPATVCAQDSVRLQTYVESISIHRYLPSYYPNWGFPKDLGKVKVTLDTHVNSLPGTHVFSKTYYPTWQWPTTIETVQPLTEEFTAQGCPGFTYVEPETYNK